MKISVFSLWRNSCSYINESIGNLKALEKDYDDIEFEYFFYENDSEDETAEILERFMKNRKGKFISEKLNAPSFGSTLESQRMLSLTKYRNKILHEARPLQSDYSILWDSDVAFKPDILNKFLKHKDVGAMLVSNVRQNIPCSMGSGDDDSYYDSLSLVDRFSIQCMTWSSNPFYDEEDRAKYEQNLPIKIISGFGGFVLIRSDVLNKAEWFSRGQCEHWGFCAQINKLGEEIFFVPDARPTVHHPESEIKKHQKEIQFLLTFQGERLKMSSWERQLDANELVWESKHYGQNRSAFIEKRYGMHNNLLERWDSHS